MATVVLGIDVGGSGTRAVAADLAGRVVGLGVGPAGNHQGVGLEGTRQAVQTAVAAAGIDLADVAVSHVGAAGVDLPGDADRIAGVLELPGLTVENDALLGLWCGAEPALSHGWGAVVVAGTGTNAVARAPGGEPAFCGGVGWHTGDVGGALQLGIEGLRAAIRSWEGREEPSALTAACCSLGGVDDGSGLLALVGTWQGPDPLAVAQQVVGLGAAGDPLCVRLLQHVGTEMGLAAAIALARAGIAHLAPPTIVLGGLGRASGPDGPLLRALTEELGRRVPGSTVELCLLPPVVGAVRAALHRAGVPVPRTAALADQVEVAA